VEPLPEKTVILHVGDSMAGALGIELNRQLEEHGIKGVLRYKTATFIPGWAWGEELGLYLAQYRPDLVIISLGTNELEIQEPERRAPTVRKLVGRLGGLPCVWLLPPLGEGRKSGLVEVIRQSASPCVCVDNQDVFPGMPRVGDKIHPTMAARKEWARRVLDWLGAHRRPSAGRPWEISSESTATGPNSTR
jgi:lysophospholipase L1-like esterase